LRRRDGGSKLHIMRPALCGDDRDRPSLRAREQVTGGHSGHKAGGSRSGGRFDKFQDAMIEVRDQTAQVFYLAPE
jgi:hypothetical protein